MKIPQDVKLAITAAEHRAENEVTTAIEEMSDLLMRYPILRYDTASGIDHPLALLSGIHAKDEEVIEILKRRNR